jgi:hypothetical protein
MRGIDVGKITMRDFFSIEGAPLDVSSLSDTVVGMQLCIAPNGTKTVKGRRAAAQTFTLTEDRQFCFVHRLINFLSHSQGAGYPITGYLFRPCTADKKSFKEQACSSSSLCHSLQKYLRQAGLFAGETMHSLRRGGMQSDVHKGASFADVQAKAQLKSPGVVKRYLDPSRHVPKLIKKGLKRKGACAR